MLKKYSRNLILSVSIVVLLLLNFLLLYRVSKLNSQLNSSKFPSSLFYGKDNHFIPHFSVLDIFTSQKIYSKDIISVRNFSLIILFSPYDCANCQREREFWKRLSFDSTLNNINIVSIANNGSPEELRRLKTNLGFNFPIYFDTDENRDATMRIMNRDGSGDLQLKINNNIFGRWPNW